MDASDPNLTPEDLLRLCRFHPRGVLSNPSLPLVLVEDPFRWQEIVLRSRFAILQPHLMRAFVSWHFHWPHKKDVEAAQAVIECFGELGGYRGYIKPLSVGRLSSLVIQDVLSIFASGMERSYATGEIIGPPYEDMIEVTDRIARVYPPLEPASFPQRADFPW